MSTLIRLKRRKKSENEGVTLHAGEPYYNMADKALYIGDTSKDNEAGDLPDKHIAEVTNTSEAKELYSTDDDKKELLKNYTTEGTDTVKFYIGGSENNSYTQKINKVDVSNSLILHPIFYGDADPSNLFGPGKSAFNDGVPDGLVYFKKVTT